VTLTTKATGSSVNYSLAANYLYTSNFLHSSLRLRHLTLTGYQMVVRRLRYAPLHGYRLEDQPQSGCRRLPPIQQFPRSKTEAPTPRQSVPEKLPGLVGRRTEVGC
jgi:hypothetical protein